MQKLSLTQKLLQKLSPQQIQLMKLLQIPTLMLEQRIKEELEVNPALEEGPQESEDSVDNEKEEEEINSEAEEKEIDDEVDIEDYMSDDEIADYKLQDGNYADPDDEKRNLPIPLVKTFHDYLEQQLGMLDLDDKEYIIAQQIIGSLDDDGYMRREPLAMVDDLAFSQNVEASEKEILEVLNKIQTIEPAGVGARSLQECLLLQITRKNQEDKNIQFAIKIIEKYFEEFVKKHYEKLQKQLAVSEEQLKEVLDEILKLNPKPGSSYSESSSNAEMIVVPDFILKNEDGDLIVSLNGRNAPELKISKDYKNMLKAYNEGSKKDKKQKEAVLFIKQKLDAASWFIEAIKQRNNTLLGTMNTLLEYQYDFFVTGDETKLKPMILKDIAEKTGLDISTISRVSNSKYVQTEFGTYPLKYFFSESLSTDTGEEVSTREVKKILEDLISAEDKKRPLSDEKLMEELNEKGYNIARRTVAKYREQLNLPVARLRKEL